MVSREHSHDRTVNLDALHFPPLALQVLRRCHRFIATPILPESFTQSAGGQFRSMGVDFASTEDATSAVLRLVTDKSINGMAMRSIIDVSWHIVEKSFGQLTSHSSLGRTLAVVPRQISESGYIDLEKDDFKPGEPLHLLQSVASSLVYGKFGSS